MAYIGTQFAPFGSKNPNNSIICFQDHPNHRIKKVTWGLEHVKKCENRRIVAFCSCFEYYCQIILHVCACSKVFFATTKWSYITREVHNVEKKVKTTGHIGRGPFVSFLMIVTRKNIFVFHQLSIIAILFQELIEQVREKVGS